MILARISKAVREQNWFAVAIEFVIVILGVVIGFQINGWAEQRRQAEAETGFIARLDADLAALEERHARLVDGAQLRLTGFLTVQAMLDPASQIETAADLSCYHIVVSYLVGNSNIEIPALDQLMASGDRQIVQDAELNAAISTFLERRENFRRTEAVLQDRSINLAERYPELIRRRLALTEDSVSGVTPMDRSSFPTECDVAAMRNDNAFLNDLTHNTELLTMYLVAVLRGMGEHIEEFRNAVDAYSGVAQ